MGLQGNTSRVKQFPKTITAFGQTNKQNEYKIK